MDQCMRWEVADSLRSEKGRFESRRMEIRILSR